MLNYFNREKLKSIILDEYPISRRDFEGCINLESLVIPESIDAVPADTFAGCKKLINIKCNPKLKEVHFKREETIPYWCTTITKSRFKNYENLEYLWASEKINYIEPGALDSCKILRYMKLSPHLLKYSNRKNLEVIIIQKDPQRLFLRRTSKAAKN